MAFNKTASNNATVQLSCLDSKNYRNPYNNFTCIQHKNMCKTWSQILREDEFDELLESCPVTCNWCINSSLPSISSFVKNNDKSVNALQPHKLTTVAVLSTFGFVFVAAVLAGFFVVHRRPPSDRDGSFPQSTRETKRLPMRQDRAFFRGEHVKVPVWYPVFVLKRESLIPFCLSLAKNFNRRMPSRREVYARVVMRSLSSHRIKCPLILE
eukprot:CCRYP_006483-RC/>CCRYP_006483-RC protein AED:0.02 eAED:0.02 QI:101/1/1/1/1/1/2/570/210